MCPLITPDFEEKPQLPPGEYAAKIVGCEMKTSKKGTPYLSFKFETLDSRQWVFTNTGLSGKGAQLFKAIVKAAYMPGYESGPIDTDKLLGRTLNVKCDFQVNPDGTEGKYVQVFDVAPFEDPFDAFEQ